LADNGGNNFSFPDDFLLIPVIFLNKLAFSSIDFLLSVSNKILGVCYFCFKDFTSDDFFFDLNELSDRPAKIILFGVVISS